MRDAVLSAAYRAQQLSLLFPALAFQRTMRAVSRRGFKPERERVRDVQRRYQKLLSTDLANVRAGLYPRSLLFQFPLTDYLRQMPHLVLDFPRTLRRVKRQDFKDLPADADSDRYPAYYRRNFHWQTDGYFSRHSARLYDIGVEWLFLGTADVMRRQVIPPITRHLRELGSGGAARLVDIACGTGRTLKQISASHPNLSLVGVDLSPYYVHAARDLLADHADASFVVDNAERMPLLDESADVVTSVYLFHELPRDARERVFAEMFRVLRPGGLAVVADSAQASSTPDLAPFLGRFTVDFHEPYYKGYQRHPLEQGLGDAGFAIDSINTHFVTKLVVARKPL